jgi:oligoribonuclease
VKVIPAKYTIQRDVTPEMVWIDLETCGLRPEDRILELGLKVTNRHGDEAGAFTSVVGYSDAMVSGEWLSDKALGPVVYEMHTRNGLIDEVLVASSMVANNNRCGYSRTDVESRALDFLWEAFNGYPEPSLPMAGASVQFDRAALRSQMARLHNWFHYRQYDVSTVLGLAAMSGHVPDETVLKRSIHRALPDIDDEISVHRWAMSKLVARV